MQNKIDLVSQEEAQENYQQIKKFTKGTCAENAPIIPVSAHHDINIDALIMAMEKYIPTPQRDTEKPPLMYIARSFDINKPGNRPEQLVGGVIGGSLMQGVLDVDDEIEIAPGRRVEIEGKSVLQPIRTTVHSIMAGGSEVNQASPGGLLALGTMLDPARVKSDSLGGRIVGKPGQLPKVLDQFYLMIHLLQRTVGTHEEKQVEPLRTNEPLMLTVGTATTVGIVNDLRDDLIGVKLKLEVCASEGQRVAVSRRIEGKWHLIGYGEIRINPS